MENQFENQEVHLQNNTHQPLLYHQYYQPIYHTPDRFPHPGGGSHANPGGGGQPSGGWIPGGGWESGGGHHHHHHPHYGWGGWYTGGWHPSSIGPWYPGSGWMPGGGWYHGGAGWIREANGIHLVDSYLYRKHLSTSSFF